MYDKGNLQEYLMKKVVFMLMITVTNVALLSIYFDIVNKDAFTFLGLACALYFLLLFLGFKTMIRSLYIGIYYLSFMLIYLIIFYVDLYHSITQEQKYWFIIGAFVILWVTLNCLFQKIYWFKDNCEILRQAFLGEQYINFDTMYCNVQNVRRVKEKVKSIKKYRHLKLRAFFDAINLFLIIGSMIYIIWSSHFTLKGGMICLAIIVFWFYSAIFLENIYNSLELIKVIKDIENENNNKPLRYFRPIWKNKALEEIK